MTGLRSHRWTGTGGSG